MQAINKEIETQNFKDITKPFSRYAIDYIGKISQNLFDRKIALYYRINAKAPVKPGLYLERKSLD